jgi:hypothetical protein
MTMKKIMFALPEEMPKVLKRSKKSKKKSFDNEVLITTPETVRAIVSGYLRKG